MMMNVHLALITVTPMQHVPTLQGHSLVHVTVDSMVMVSQVELGA